MGNEKEKALTKLNLSRDTSINDLIVKTDKLGSNPARGSLKQLLQLQSNLL